MIVTVRETNKVKEKEKDRHKDVIEKREETSDRSREKRTKERKEDREDRPHSGKVIRACSHVIDTILNFDDTRLIVRMNGRSVTEKVTTDLTLKLPIPTEV